MLLDCLEPVFLLLPLWVIVLYLAVLFPKVSVLFLRHFLVAFLRMPRCNLCPLQSSAPVFTAKFHTVLEGAMLFSEPSLCLPLQVLLGFVAVYVVHPFAGKSADLRGRRSLSGWWSLNGRLWTKVCNRICSVHSSSESCDLTRGCISCSCASVVSRPVSPVSSASPVLVGGVGGSRVGLGVFFSRGGVEGGLSRCLRVSARDMGGGAAPGSTNSWSDTAHACCPTGSFCTKGGISGPAEDLRPVSEVEAGVNFRPAGGVRGQVAGSIPRRQPDRNQARQGRCGHTFPPPAGSWYPIRVTWIKNWTSGNRWAGRGCVEPHDRGFGC